MTGVGSSQLVRTMKAWRKGQHEYVYMRGLAPRKTRMMELKVAILQVAEGPTLLEQIMH